MKIYCSLQKQPLPSDATKLKPEVRCERGQKKAQEQKVYSLSYLLLVYILRKPTGLVVPKEKKSSYRERNECWFFFLEVCFWAS